MKRIATDFEKENVRTNEGTSLTLTEVMKIMKSELVSEVLHEVFA